ncbi:MAG: hypothetical protein GXP55_09785 [Deltaproteobacteria bacterium]|nr:hypothetical protein [Deltaproteobacteria bacterium]
MLWTQQFGSSGSDICQSVVLDGNGNVYVGGYTNGSIDAANAGANDVFVRKYSVLGSLIWGRQLGTAGDDYGRSLAVDAVGTIYISGDTSGALTGTNLGFTDAFVARYSPVGTAMTGWQLGTDGFDSVYSMAIDSYGLVYLAGNTLYRRWPGQTNAGGRDAFVTSFLP